MPKKGNVTRPRIEPMLMIRPSRCRRMEGSTARVTRRSPMTFVSKMTFACSAVKASVTPADPMPALLTSTSILPASASTVSTPASTDASSLTSNSTVLMPSVCRIAATSRFLPRISRIEAYTVWPARERVSAVSRPKPLLAPVIRIVLDIMFLKWIRGNQLYCIILAFCKQYLGIYLHFASNTMPRTIDIMKKKKQSSKTIEMRSDCPISFALDMFGDKWTLLIVRDLVRVKRMTFKDFLGSGEGIATNILSDRLQRLETLGIISKEMSEADKRIAQYELTQLGLSLKPVLRALARWSTSHNPGTRIPKS